MKFAFMIMGDFDTDQDSAVIHEGSARIVGVASVEEACAEAKKLLPDNMYITLKYYVRPYFDGDGQISLDNAALDISFNLSENTDAIEKCLEYFDIDVQAAIELARTQLDTYVLDILGRM